MNLFRFLIRPFRQHPAFAAIAVLTLALGIGANTAIFSVIHAVLIRPFPYPEQEQIVFISGVLRRDATATTSVNSLDLLDFQREATAFAGLGGAQDAQLVVTGSQEAARVKGANVSPSVLELLRTPPLLGRLLLPSDDVPGAAPVCVLSDRAWERFFQRNPNVVGKSVVLNGTSHEVVGVMPGNFKFWNAWFYRPLTLGIPEDLRNTRGVQMNIWAVGRLKPGISHAQATEDLDRIARRIEAAFPIENRDLTVRVQELAETVGASLRPTLLLLFGAVGCVLLIACVNVTNLLLAQGASRSRELAVRTALGATQGRILRLLLGETLPLGLLAAAFGILLAWGGLKLILSVIPVELIPAEATVRLSWPVLAFTVGVSLVTSLVAGLVPAWQASRIDSADALKEGGRTVGGERVGRLRSGLVVAEVALAFTLLIGAGLLVRSLLQVARIDPGFRVDNLVVASAQLPESRYSDPDRSLALIRNLRERVHLLPGVVSSGILGTLPMTGDNFSVPLLVEGRTYTAQDDLRSVTYTTATPGAMEAIGLKLKEGRFFNELDRAGGERVAILNAKAARQFFGDENPVGRKVASGVPRSLLSNQEITGLLAALADPPFARVIGVVSDTRRYSLTAEPPPEVFYPFEQGLAVPMVRNNLGVVVHSHGNPQNVVAALRQELRNMDSELPLDTVRTMTSIVDESLRGQRFVVVLLGLFAGLALLLATLGIYSVMAWMVSQRTRELGIRLALGASPWGMIRMVVAQGSRPVLLGLLLGLGLALALSRVIASQLVNTTPHDVPTYAVAGLGLLAVALLACWIPARRAARVDPMNALRSE
ncbi:MAG: ABC transporter permease [Verrucomicrobia bacterium]|nr:ABC transporter permease [Verrucomicrobiota bacterium]